jgi:predicted flap endonuclease-1-like 5' DNA nuclease
VGASEPRKGGRVTHLLLALALLGSAAYAASRLLRGRCALTGSGPAAWEDEEEAEVSYITLGALGTDELEHAVSEEVLRDEAAAETGGGPRLYDLEQIEGIGPVYAEQLSALGLQTTDDLLHAGAGPKGREDLALATGISSKLILRWVNQADLFRIKGVGEEYADLLEAAGVDTVPELAQRRADNLTKRMAEVNEQKALVRRLPTESQVAGWIEIAKTLPRVVTY